MTQPIIFDAHLDLSMNALEWNRDLRWSVPEIRASERGMTDRPDRGRGTVSFDAMRRGRVGAVRAPRRLRAMCERGSAIPGWHSQEQAWAQTQGQLAWYRAMEEAGEMVPITYVARGARSRTWARWQPSTGRARADRLRADPRGRRLAGHAATISSGRTRRACARSARRTTARACYAQGTNATGGLGEKGRALAAGDGAARHHPRRHAPVRREFLGEPRRVPRPRLGQPQQLPGARARTTASSRMSRSQGARRARRGHRRRVRRVDAGARLGARHRRRRRAAASRSRRSSTTSTTSARWPATRATPASARTSMAASAPNRGRPTWTRSRICRSCPRCWRRAAIRREDVENVCSGNFLRFLRNAWS